MGMLVVQMVEVKVLHKVVLDFQEKSEQLQWEQMKLWVA